MCFSFIITWSYANVKDSKFKRVTSLLLSASNSVVSQNVSGCRLFGNWLLGFFYLAAFSPTNSASLGVIWIDCRAVKDLRVLIIWTTNWSHMKNKGTKQKSKRKGSENAFGCDLTEQLQNSGQDGKPSVLLHQILLQAVTIRGSAVCYIATPLIQTG